MDHKNLKMAIQLIGLFIVILIASFVSNALIIIGVNVYYHATISDAQQAADAISSALSSIPVIFVILLLQNAAFVFVAWLFLTKIDKEKFSLDTIGLGFRSDMSKLILAGLLLDMALFLPIMLIILLWGCSSFVSIGTASFSVSTILLSFILMAIGTLAIGSAKRSCSAATCRTC